LAAIQNLEIIESAQWLPNVKIKRFVYFSEKESHPNVKTRNEKKYLKIEGTMKAVMEQEIQIRKSLRQTKEIFLWTDQAKLNSVAGLGLKGVLSDVSEVSNKQEAWRPLKFQWENTKNLQMELNFGVADVLKKSLKCTGRIHHIEELEHHIEFWQRQVTDVTHAVRYDPFEFPLFHTPQLLTQDKAFAERLRHITDPELTIPEVF